MSIAERLAVVRERVDAACVAAGRDPGEVTLIAVSKTRPVEELAEAREAGQEVFGENYAQELRDKAAALEGVQWHFIGHLQRNKVRYVVGTAALIHTVDSLRLGEAIAARAQAPQPVLVEVKLGDETTKTGTSEHEALALCRALVQLPGLSLRGLMTIPPVDRPPGPFFARLAALAAEGRAEGLPLHELSMGMSADFEEAIAHGATLVRVGTAIFGPRRPFRG